MREGALIGPIIVAIGLVFATVSYAIVGALMDRAKGDSILWLERLESRVDTLETDLNSTKETLRKTSAKLDAALSDLARQANTLPRIAPDTAAPKISETAQAGDHNVTEGLTISQANFNTGITQPNNRLMLEVLGRPRPDLSQECKSITHPKIRALLETRQIGPIQVTMIKPALESLERILAKLEATEPNLYHAVGTAGTICARFVRGSTRSISNHSWGTAIDITIKGKLDGLGDGNTQFGLILLAELFNEEGWFWGATYGREDSMHFEVGAEKMREWAEAGLI